MPSPRLAAMLGRHQVSSLVATVVDFGVMIGTVEILHGSPVLGTVFGAFCGAVANFTLGRYWIFRAGDGRIGWQFAKYAFVSSMSLGINALGVYVLAEVGSVQYVISRVLVAVLTSLCWNFPMQRSFVFSTRPRL